MKTTAFSLSFSLLLWASLGFALDIGKLFKRRPMTRKMTQQNEGREVNPDEVADEILHYSTPCDQQLANSIVILGEQKSAAEKALISCRESRQLAENDVDLLTVKVERAHRKLAEVDEMMEEKLNLVRAEADMKIEEVKLLLATKEAFIDELKNEHAKELKTAVDMQAAAVKALKESNAREIAMLQETNEEKISNLNKKLKSIQIDQLNEREQTTSTLQKAQAEHQKQLNDLEQQYKSAMAKSETDFKQSLERVEADRDKKFQSLSSQLSTCDSELKSNKHALASLERDHERALQKIAVLENVTVYSLALQEAKEYVKYIEEKVEAEVHPLYKKYLKDSVDKVKVAAEKVRPLLLPVIEPMTRAFHTVEEKCTELSSQAFKKIKKIMVKEVCPKSRTLLKEWKRKKVLDSPAMTKAIEQACSEPVDFLTFIGKIMLVVSVFAFRKIIFRMLLWLLLLPIRILLLPVTLLTSKVATNKEQTKNAAKK